MKLIKFYADWCGPCKTLAPIIDKVVKENPLTLEYVPVNVDNDLDDLTSQHNIKGVPSVVIIADNGTVKSTIVGVQPEQIYLDAIKN